MAQISVGGSVPSGSAVVDAPTNVAGADGGGLVRLILTDTGGRQVVVGSTAAAAAVIGNPVLVGGSDGTNARFMGVNAANQVLVNSEGQKATYRACSRGLVTVTGATDVFTLIGSATKTVRVTRVRISGTMAAASYFDMALIVRSTADTGGTSTAPTVVPLDSGSAAGTAVATAYTGNPTLGSAVGTIDVVKYLAQITTTVTNPGSQVAEFLFGTANGQTCVLRGVAQNLAINFGAGGPAQAGAFDIMIEWTEE